MAEPLDDRRREVPTEVVLLEVLGVREVRPDELRRDRSLRVRQQHRELGTHHPLTVRAPLHHLLGTGQELDLAIELAVRDELLHQILVRVDALHGEVELLREDLRLQVVVVQDVLDDVGRARLEQLVALRRA